MTLAGIDYAFGTHPAATAIKAAGYGFVCRYMSNLAVNDANGKNLLAAELHQLLAAGLEVVVVEESTAGRMKSGHAAGVADAQHGQAVTRALGMDGAVIYFACDFDAAPADQTAINAYLDGAASVIGRERTGIYGGYYPLHRALDAGRAAYGWQTYAWSGATASGPAPYPHTERVEVAGQPYWFDTRAQLRQLAGVSVGGVSVDLDEAMAADFGQWPRPAADSGPVPVPTGLKQAAVTSDVRLSWNAVTGQSTYRLQTEWYKQGFGWVLQVNEQVTQAYVARGLVAGRYRWRVAAGSVDHVWSAWKEFEV